MHQYQIKYIDFKGRDAVGYLCADTIEEARRFADHAQGVDVVKEVKPYEVQAARLPRSNH